MLLVYVITTLYFMVVLESTLPSYKKKFVLYQQQHLLIASFCFVLAVTSCWVQ